MKQRSADSGGNGDQVALAVKDLYLRSARHLGQVHSAAAPDESDAFFISGDARQLWGEHSGMDKKRFDNSLLHCRFERCQRVGIFDYKLGDSGAPQTGEMRSAALFLTHVVSH